MLLLLVVLPALALTANRVLHPDIGPLVMLGSFAPYATVLYALAFVGLVLTRRRSLRWPAALVSVLLGLHVWWVAPAIIGGHAAPSDTSFTVMTANLMIGKADPGSLMRAVIDEQVDVLVLEEVPFWHYRNLHKLGIDEAFPHRTAASEDRGSTVVFSRYPLTDAAQVPVSQGGEQVTVDAPGGPVELLAVHCTRAFRSDASDWAADHRVVAKVVRTLSGPAMVVGDFNASAAHAPIRRLDGLGFKDSAEVIGAGYQPTWPSDGRVSVLGIPVPPLFRIDHVLVNRGLSVIDSRTVTIAGTDHRAVVAELDIR